MEETRVSQGACTPKNPNISIVVMSTNSDPKTFWAVKSIVENQMPSEIIVVNTGVGTLTPTLQDFRERIVLIETSIRKNPGGTRNLGIKHATAPVIAFLAADCTISDEWIDLRLQAHKRHEAVASTLRPTPEENGQATRASWASYIATHYHRIPEIPAEKARLFGMSYSTQLLWELGLFDESIRTGEDSLLNQKIKKITAPYLDPRIITYHKYPTTLTDALIDQFRRGRRFSSYNKLAHGYGRCATALSTLKKSIAAYIEIATNKNHHPSVRRNNCLALLLSISRMAGNLFPSNE